MPKYTEAQYQAAIKNALDNNRDKDAEVLTAAFQRDYPPQQRAAESAMQANQPGLMEAIVRGAGQGLTLGFGDEITGAVESAFTDKSYAQARDESRVANDAARTAHPYGFGAGEFGSALVPGLGTFGALGKVPAAAGALTKAGRLAATGLVTGAAAGTGYSAAPSAGGVFEDAAVGGAAGAVLSPLIAGGAGLAARAGGSLLDRAARTMGETPQTFARRRVASRLVDDDYQNADEVIDELRQLGPQARLADIGPNMRAEAEAAYKNAPGPGRRLAEDVLTQRQAGQQGRLNEAARNTLNPQWDDFYQFRRDLTAAREATSRPLYEQASRVPIRMTERLRSLVDRPGTYAAQAWARSEKVLANDIERALPIKDPRTGQMSSLARWDATLKVLQDDIGKALRAGEKNKARQMIEQKNVITRELYEQNPAYQQARSAFAGAKQLEEAAEWGREILSGNKNWGSEVEESLRGYSSSETEAFRIGLVRGIMDKVESKSLSHDSASAFMPERIRGILREAFPDENAFNSFLRSVDAETIFRGTRNQTLGGSRTAQLLGQGQEMPGMQEAQLAVNAGTGNIIGSLGAYIMQKLRPDTRMNPQQAEQVGRLLFDHLDETAIRRLFDRAVRRGTGAPGPVGETFTMATGLAPAPVFGREYARSRNAPALVEEDEE